MKCPSCQTEVPEGSKFCQQCGASLSQPVNGPVILDATPVSQPVSQPVAQPVAQPVQQPAQPNGFQQPAQPGQPVQPGQPGGYQPQPGQPVQPGQQPVSDVPVVVIPPAGEQQYAPRPEMPFGNPTNPGNPGGAPLNPGAVDPKAIVSLVCGIVGLVVFALILGIIAIVTGVNARGQNPVGTTSRKMASAGLVIGIIDVAFGVLSFLVSFM